MAYPSIDPLSIRSDYRSYRVLGPGLMHNIVQKTNFSRTGINRPLGGCTTIFIDVPSTGFFFCLLERNSLVTIEIDGKKLVEGTTIKMVVRYPKGLSKYYMN